jgi:hypothetical protein
MTENPDDGHYDPALDDEECPNCGGEGVIYCCEDEGACVDPESGCDLCERRCDWCRPRKPQITGIVGNAQGSGK